MDWFATTPLRKPLMALAAIAVFLTFKNGRSSVRRSRAMGWLGGGSRSAVSSSLYGSTFGRSVKSSPPYPAGAGAAAVGGGGNLPYGNQQQQQHPGTMYGGQQQQQQQAVGGQLGGQVGYGNTLGAYGANAAGGTYGNQGIAARPMGTAPGAQAGGYGASTGTVMGGGRRAAAAVVVVLLLDGDGTGSEGDGRSSGRQRRRGIDNGDRTLEGLRGSRSVRGSDRDHTGLRGRRIGGAGSQHPR